MAVREVIRIDRDKCTGCGQCVNACVGGALELIEGKATVTREDYCDGLGVCVGECPVGALTIEQRDAEEYSTPAAGVHHSHRHHSPDKAHHGGACPGSQAVNLGGCPGKRELSLKADDSTSDDKGSPSALSQWPIQLHLIRPDSPQFQGEDILVAASCTAFSCGGFHPQFLKGKKLIIACPKLDDKTGYLEKLTAIFAHGNPRSVSVLRMEVPCCSGLSQMVQVARAHAGSEITIKDTVITLQGEVKAEQSLEV